jgi:hypothetical protein
MSENLDEWQLLTEKLHDFGVYGTLTPYMALTDEIFNACSLVEIRPGR